VGRYLRRLRAHQRKRVRDFSEGRISTAIGKVPSTSPMMYEQEEVTRRFNPFDIRSYEKLRNLIDTTVFSSPSRTAIASFFLVIIFFTVTLSLPISSVTGEPAPFHHAFFTATSAVTVTGLTTVSTAAQWSVGYDSARLSDWWFRCADHDLASCPGDRAKNGFAL